MSKKGDDVKHLFAHLGLDPDTYRDMSGGASGSSRTSHAADKPEPSPAKTGRKKTRAQDLPDEAKQPPRVGGVADDPADEPAVAAQPVDTGSTAESPTEPAAAGEHLTAEDDHVAAEPDRWSLLAMVGNGQFPVADLPEPEAVVAMTFGGTDATRTTGAASQAGESDTPRLRRAGSLSALWKGAREAAGVSSTADEESAPAPVDEPAAHAEAVDESTQAATVDDHEASVEAETDLGTMNTHDDKSATGKGDTGSSSTPPKSEPAVTHRKSTGAIGKMMDRLREAPVERHTAPPRLKLNYERRENTVVAEEPVDQDIATVFGRLKRSRVD